MSKPNPPALVLIGGPPGSGKSTLARALAHTCGVPLLDKDTIKSALLAMDSDADLASRASYELLLPLAVDMLRLGLPVILDAPGRYRPFLDACRREAGACDAAFLCILCHATVDLRRDRLRQRAPLLSQWTSIPDVGADMLDEWRAVFPDDVLILDTLEEPVALVQKVLTWLGWDLIVPDTAGGCT